MNNLFKVSLLSAAVLTSSQAQAGFWNDVGDWFKGAFDKVENVADDIKDKLIDVTQDGIFYVDNGLSLVKGFAKGIANTSNGAVINHQDVSNFEATWVAKAWGLQRDISQHVPMAEANMIGTHNSFNAETYANATRYLDPQHKYSIYDQLRMGARFIELDAHWTTSNTGNPFKWKTKLLLCHSGIGKEIGNLDVGCSPTDRPVKAGLYEIANFLNEPENQDEVMILYIEDHMNNHHQEMYNELMDVLGDKIYKSGGCNSIPNDLTPAKMLNENKQIVIRGHGCSGNFDYKNTIYTSLGGISKIAEDGTNIGALSGAERITVDDVRDGFRDDDRNLINLDWMSPSDGRIEAGIWSWANNEPNNANNEDCAVQNDDGRWNDTSCNAELHYACQDSENGDWAVSYDAGQWAGGEAACQSVGVDYHFATPISSKHNQALLDQRSGQDKIWLNYHDRNQEGQWQVAGQKKVYNDAWRPLVNGRSHLCMDVKGGNTGNGVKVQQYSCHEGTNQLWKYDRTTGQVKNKKSGKCLDISGNDNNVNNDVQLQMWECSSSAIDQTWNIDGNTLRNRVDTSKVIDAYGDSEGSKIGLWGYHGGANQQWFWAKAPAKRLQFKNLVNKSTGKCLDIKNGNSDNKEYIHQNSCHGGDRQLWAYDEERNVLKNKKGRCLYARGGVVNDNYLRLWSCNEGWMSLRYLVSGNNTDGYVFTTGESANNNATHVVTATTWANVSQKVYSKNNQKQKWFWRNP